VSSGGGVNQAFSGQSEYRGRLPLPTFLSQMSLGFHQCFYQTIVRHCPARPNVAVGSDKNRRSIGLLMLATSRKGAKSAMGQKQKWPSKNRMSVPSSRADTARPPLDVRLVPQATHTPPQIIRYSITSSARASRDGGTVRPIAFAVLRLITNSYLVGAWTGRSAGFSPLRMRST
jgi:hypothetical protein